MTQKKKENQVSVFLVPKEKTILADKKFLLKYGFEVVDTVKMNMNYWHYLSMGKNRIFLKA